MIDTNTSVCIIQTLESQLSPTGDELLTEFDCPIFELTDTLLLVSPSVIMGPVSMVHLCSETCKIIQEAPVRLIEREEVSSLSTNKVSFKHDLTNKLYCFNIYCIGNYFDNL